MNKIKAKINSDDFSPWEDSFNSLLETMEITKRRKHPWNQFQTVEPRVKSLSKQKQKQKSILTRTFLNMSKINLNDSQEKKHETIQHSESKRYAGPRATFYAQMNPKINGKTKPILDPEQFAVKQKSYSNGKQVTSRMIRDESIKYLQIIDQKPPQITHRQSIASLLNRQVNLKKIGLVKARVNDEHNSYLRRLKMIYKKK